MSLKPNFDAGIAGDTIAQAKQKFVGDILKKRAFLTPERTALEWGDHQWTFSELNAEVNQLADSFQKIGILRGQRISVLTQNRGECIHIVYAAAKIGAIVSFLNWRYTEIETQEAIDVITPETVIVSEEFSAKIQNVLGNLPYVKRLIFLDDVEPVKLNISVHSFAKLISEGDRGEPDVTLHEEDAFFIVYTSGTTGIPKGATISQRSAIQRVIANLATFPALIGTTGEDCCVCRGPFFHVVSVDEAFATHALGGKAVVLAGYNVSEMVDVLEREYVGWLSLSPAMYEKLIAEIKRRNATIKGVRAVGSMPELSPTEEIIELTKILDAPFLNTYGSTEAGFLTFTQNVFPVGAAETANGNMAKKEAFFCDVRLIDNDDNDVPHGEAGELIIRTPMMFSGYWNNPAENEKAFRDGWYRTGDVLRRNPDGTLEFVSRKKYMIKSGAENVYPAEIERVLLRHPQVREACVVGAVHPKWGETPIAFVSVADDVNPDDVKTFCKKNLAGYRVPNLIEIVDIDDFPRNTTGKILREKVEPWVERIQHKIV